MVGRSSPIQWCKHLPPATPGQPKYSEAKKAGNCWKEWPQSWLEFFEPRPNFGLFRGPSSRKEVLINFILKEIKGDLLMLKAPTGAYSADKNDGRQKSREKILRERNYGNILVLKKNNYGNFKI